MSSLCEKLISKEQYNDTKNYILYNLGYPAVKVELKDEQLQQAIEQALNVISNYTGLKRYAYTLTQRHVSEYTVPADCRTVMKVYYNMGFLSVLGNTSTAMFSDFYLLASDLAVDIYESPLTFWSYLASREMLTKVYGTWTSFEVIEGGKKLRIYPTPVREDTLVIFYRSREINLDDDNFNFFSDLSLAYAKRMLGRIRSKYQSGLPSSGGGSLTLDGNNLLQESEQTIKDIKAELQSRDPFMPEIF
jgi:hypothetical protein